MALFSASRARFSAGDRSLSGARASSGLCMRSLSWCLRSALAVRMGAESPEYAGIRLRQERAAVVSSGTSACTKDGDDSLPSHGVGPLLLPETVLQRIPLRISFTISRRRPLHAHAHTHISRRNNANNKILKAG